MPLKELADRRALLHAKSDPQTILRHAMEDVQIGDVALVSSFGAERVVLLHMAARIDRAVPVLFLETEMLFAETLEYQQQVAERLGLEDVRIHDLRHTYASILINNEVSIYEVQRLLGHSNVTMTQRYAHLLRGKLHEKTELVSKAIQSPWT